MKTRIIQSAAAVLVFAWACGGAPAADEGKPAAAVLRDSSNSNELSVQVLRYSPDDHAIVVRFENRTDKGLKLLRPLDGSECGWHMPYYDVSMTDSAGKAVPLAGRCGFSGLYSVFKWPDDYRIQILPGDAYEMRVYTARDMVSGKFSVCFRYTYYPAVVPGRKADFQYPSDLWVGSVASKPVDIVIPESPQ